MSHGVLDIPRSLPVFIHAKLQINANIRASLNVYLSSLLYRSTGFLQPLVCQVVSNPLRICTFIKKMD